MCCNLKTVRLTSVCIGDRIIIEFFNLKKKRRRKMNKRLYVDFHVLQTLPPSCVNRDDTAAQRQPIMGERREPEYPRRHGSAPCA